VTLSGQSVPRRKEGAQASVFGADFVVLDPSGRMLRGLNPTAARIWELIDGTRSLDGIAATVAQEFGEPPERVLGDVSRFVTLLVEKGLADTR
jgi:pyrroloquinoline quinone biosynthesis protein D